MTEIKRVNVDVPAGELVIGDVVLIANENFCSSLKIEGELVGNVSVFRKPMMNGELYPTNAFVTILSGGYLIGNIYNVDKVDISGECSGDIKSTIIIIRNGALVKGNINCYALYGGNDAEIQGKISAYTRKAIT